MIVDTLSEFKCIRCYKTKNVCNFPKYKKGRGFQGVCKSCKAEWMRLDRIKNPIRYKNHDLKTYGINVDSYNLQLKKQDGRCAICKKENPYKNRKWLYVDHDHNTGVFRGLLCGSCNSAIGLLKENIKTLKCAIDYLEWSNACQEK